MKRVYEKPALHIEKFMLTQSIASGCDVISEDFGKPNQASQEVCGWEFPGVEIFYDPNVCDFPTDYFAGLCYNAPYGGQTVFAAS